MRADARKVNISGMDFTVQALPATVAMKLQIRLGKALGPSLGTIFAAFKGGLLEADVSQLGPAIRDLFAQLDDQEFDYIRKTLLQSTVCIANGKQAGVNENFDGLFTGDIFGAYELLYTALEVNYRDFFSRLVSKFGAMSPTLASLQTPGMT